MKLHEYQAKQIFARYGVAVPKGKLVLDAKDIESTAKALIAETGTEVVVVKAQIHAGGRGKGGGVKVAKGLAGAVEHANKILGMQLVTKQTGAEGQKVRRLYLEQGLDIARELYLALLVDREKRQIAVIASTEGGMDIEEVAEKHPEKILTTHVDPLIGLAPFQIRQIAFKLGIREKASLASFSKLLTGLYNAFVGEDASLVEVNPLIVTKGGDVVALDGKMTTDDNADFRHKDWADLRDKDEEDPVELEAKAAGLSYVSLEGNIGCLVNGAGLAMSTLDAIKMAGGDAANFLDIGTANSPEAVVAALRIIGTDPDVKAVLVNIFGGLARTDVIAQGVIDAKTQALLPQPTVVRLAGTNVEEGLRILDASPVELIRSDGFADAARRAVQASK